jgi:hypothetical protein
MTKDQLIVQSYLMSILAYFGAAVCLIMAVIDIMNDSYFLTFGMTVSAVTNIFVIRIQQIIRKNLK